MLGYWRNGGGMLVSGVIWAVGGLGAEGMLVNFIVLVKLHHGVDEFGAI